MDSCKVCGIELLKRSDNKKQALPKAKLEQEEILLENV